MPTIALVDDDRNILTSVSIALEASMPDVRRAQLHKQQSRRRYAANGFAFIPHDRAVPLPHAAIGLASTWWCSGTHASPTGESIAPAHWFEVAKK